jgi:predicted PurR-regulated permease PerM
MDSAASLSRPARILVALAAIVILLGGMKAAAPFIGPLAFSVFLTLIFGMLLHWFERKGLSSRAALILTLGIFLSIVAVFIIVIAGSVVQLLSDLPRYLQNLDGSLESLRPHLSSIGIDPSFLTVENLTRTFSADIGNVIGELVNVATPLILILLTTIFLIFEAKGFSRKLQAIIGELRPSELHQFVALAEKNVEYLVIRTKVNLVMGIGTGIILALLGVKYAAFWGFFAFLLGFIPYLGFWIAVVPPMLIAWFDLGPVPAILVLAGSGLVNTLVEYLMFPYLAAHGLDLSTAVVFISLIFWGWILGGIGAFLAVPLTLFVQMVCELNDETRWISVLLGPSPKSPAEHG